MIGGEDRGYYDDVRGKSESNEMNPRTFTLRLGKSADLSRIKRNTSGDCQPRHWAYDCSDALGNVHRMITGK